MKVCTVCKTTKHQTEFYKVSAGKYTRAHCKSCELARSARWRKCNKERIRLNQKAYVNRNRARLNEYWNEWRKNHKFLSNSFAAKRRAQKKNATPPWANEFFIKESYHLAQLRTKATGIKWEVDHIVPLQSKLVCGLHVENNLRVIPMPLNRKKSNIIWPDMPTENNHAR